MTLENGHNQLKIYVMKEDLKRLGLTFNEIKIYLSLLKLGETQVGGIISDLKIHRQIAYNALDALEKRSLIVRTLRNKINHFRINDPNIIVENIQKQELIARRLSKNIEKEIGKSKHEHEIDVFEGEAQVRSALLNNIKKMSKGEMYYMIAGTTKGFVETMGSDFFVKKFEKIRRQKNILSKLVTGKNMKDEIKDFNKIAATKIREDRYLPWDSISPMNIVIWNGKVSFYSYNSKNQFAIEIKNDFMYKAYLEHFRSLWEISKK